MLKANRVQTKINLGYAIILGFVIAIGSFGLLRLHRLNQLVTHLSSRLSVDQLLAHQIVVQFLSVQASAQHYFNNPQPAHLPPYQQAHTTLQALLTAASQQIQEPTRQQEVQEITRLYAEYSYTVEAIQLLLTDRQAISQSRLVTDTEQIEGRLAALRAEALAIGDLATVQAADRARLAFKVMQTAALVYLLQGEPEQVQTFEADYRQFLHTLSVLKTGVTSPAQQRHYAGLESALSDYYLGFRAAQADTQAQQELVNQMLPALSAQIFQRASAMESSIQVELAAGQLQARRQVQQATILTVAAILLSVLLALALSLGLTREITAPLSLMTAAARRMAAGDLAQTIPVIRADELGQLATAFNQMSTQLQQAFTTLQASEHKYRQLFENSHEAIVIASPDGSLLDFNPATVQLTGYRPDQLAQPAVLAHTFGSERYTAFWQRLIQHESLSNYEIQFPSASGQLLTVWLSATLMRAQDGSVSGFQGLLYDLTEQRKAEQYRQQQERLAAIGQLAAGIAHDFNNILAVITLYAQLLSRSPTLTPSDRQRLQTILQQAEQAARLIQQILNFSRRAILERRPTDLAQLVCEQRELLSRVLPEAIELRCQIPEGQDWTVFADPTQLKQALTNLALNARDAMPAGGSLTFALQRLILAKGEPPPLPELQPGTWLLLTVTDTGVGIPPEVLPHIFEPFFTTKAPGQGSGLGLPQVHGIVGQHGGYLDVQSRPGQGTTIFIYLPAWEQPPLQPAPSQALPLIEGQQESILVVEDNPTARQALVESLKLLNYRPQAASNGRVALDLLTQPGAAFALVLCDVVMPEMGGLALLQAIQERQLPVKVLFLTGHPLNEEELETLRTTGQATALGGWLLKPVDLEQLAHALARLLHRGTLPAKE